jgi:hypothetical protein
VKRSRKIGRIVDERREVSIVNVWHQNQNKFLEKSTCKLSNTSMKSNRDDEFLSTLSINSKPLN